MIIISKLFESDAAGDADGFGGGAHRACHEAGFGRSRKIVSGFARERGSDSADFAGASAQSVFREDDRRAAEGIRFNNVRASFEIFSVDGADNIGASDHQIFVATFQLRAAKIFSREIGLLQHGAHCAIQHQDALAQKLSKGQALLNQIPHISENSAPRILAGKREPPRK